MGSKWRRGRDGTTAAFEDRKPLQNILVFWSNLPVVYPLKIPPETARVMPHAELPVSAPRQPQLARSISVSRPRGREVARHTGSQAGRDTSPAAHRAPQGNLARREAAYRDRMAIRV